MASEFQHGVTGRRSRWYEASFLRRTVRSTVSTRHVTIGLGACIAVLGVLGTAYAQYPQSRLWPFDLNGEWDVPAAFSGLLFVAAAGALVRVRDAFSRSIFVYLFATFLIFGAVDEMGSVHEHLEKWLEVDWQRLYAPAFLVAGFVWFRLLLELRRFPTARVLYIGSALAWVVSQVLEYLQYDGEKQGPHFTPMMIAEEILEMTGTTLLLLAFLVVRDHLEPGPSSES